ncbi:MAG: cell division protein FtsZ [Chloroflexi bacterium]|nr:cell division protein FtsZ [Chloroflexota bacterium]
MTILTPSLDRKPLSLDVRKPVLKVLGLGGGGGNAVTRMMALGLRDVEFIVANTDHQVLKENLAPIKIQLGPRVTRGLGAGGNPSVGRAAAQESARELASALQGADMVFLTAGMGGGTGTGAIPVAAEIARSVGAVTIAIVTTPFSFEMGRRQRNAREGLDLLRQHTNTLIAIPNDRLLYVAPRNLPMEVAFRLADDVLRQAVQGITELITEAGMINVDFAHIRRLIQLGGGAMMSIGHGEGETKTRKAIEQALHHPLLETVSLDHAAGIIANFTGGDDLTLFEVQEALAHLQEQTSSQTEIVLGVIHDERMSDRVQITLVVTGLGAPTLEEALSTVTKPIPRASAPEKASQPLPRISPSLPVKLPMEAPLEAAAALAAKDLDLPAFLRRRARLAG